MPRVSSAQEDAFHFKGTFADGWGEIVDAKAVVFQFPPAKESKGGRSAGDQDPPGLYAAITIQRHIDGEGHKSSEQPEEVLLSIQRASRDTGLLDTCHPGNYPTGKVEGEPVDCGGELGAEGNTLFAIQDGFALNNRTKWMSFGRSLEDKGFKPEIMKRTFFPDLIGLRGYFKTETRPKFRDDQTQDPTVFVVTDIKQYPYEIKGGAKPVAKPAAGKKPAVTKAGPVPVAAAPAAAESPVAPNGSTEISAEDLAASAEDLAAAVLTETLAPTQKGALLADIKKLKMHAYMAVNKHKPPIPAALKKAVQDTLGDEDWLTTMGEVSGTFSVLEDGKVQFS